MLTDYAWCNHCERAIDPDDLKKEYEEWGEAVSLCPYCGSDDLSDAYECKDCGELFSGDDIDESDEFSYGACPKCLKYRRAAILDFKAIIEDDFSEKEIEILTDYYGIDFLETR